MLLRCPSSLKWPLLCVERDVKLYMIVYSLYLYYVVIPLPQTVQCCSPRRKSLFSRILEDQFTSPCPCSRMTRVQVLVLGWQVLVLVLGWQVLVLVLVLGWQVQVQVLVLGWQVLVLVIGWQVLVLLFLSLDEKSLSLSSDDKSKSLLLSSNDKSLFLSSDDKSKSLSSDDKSLSLFSNLKSLSALLTAIVSRSFLHCALNCIVKKIKMSPCKTCYVYAYVWCVNYSLYCLYTRT